MRIDLETLRRLPEAAAWIRHINGRAKVELSGGISFENVAAFAATGADTHSAIAVDINFRLHSA